MANNSYPKASKSHINYSFLVMVTKISKIKLIISPTAKFQEIKKHHPIPCRKLRFTAIGEF